MNSAIQAIAGILMILAAGGSITRLYREVKLTTVRAVHRGLLPLESYTRKLTGVSVLPVGRDGR
jgi:hypothetical protein